MPLALSSLTTVFTQRRISPLVAMLPAGLLLSLAFPNELLPGAAGDRSIALLGWLALLPLVWAVQALPIKQARITALLFGFGWYLGTLSWVRLFGYLPWVLLAAALALTPLLAVLLTERMPAATRWQPLWFALAFTALEWLRGQGQFGFAWSELGASQVDSPAAVIATLGGLPLLTFLMLWLTGAAVQAMHDRTAPRAMLPAAVLACTVCLLLGRGQAAASVARWTANHNGQVISVVQPNLLRDLAPSALRHTITIDEHLRRLRVLLALSYTANHARDPARAHLILWPESALSAEADDLTVPGFDAIPQLCRSTQSALLTGAPAGMSNSAYLFSANGLVCATYAKQHLVPFGEYVPWRKLVERFYIVRAWDIVPGHTRTPLTVSGHSFGVGICFESTFPGIARAYAGRDAHALVYITNDAWFHRTAAVRQHFNHARFRALETGLPVARAASTGISGFIAPDGRVLDSIPVYQAGTRTRFIPDGTPGTLYTTGGWLFGPACAGVTIIFMLLGIVTTRRRSSANATSR